MKPILMTLMICLAALSMALAQTTDIADEPERSRVQGEQPAPSAASERARLGNQRIQTETEVRAREEQRRLEEAEQERLRAREETMRDEQPIVPVSDPGPAETGPGIDMSRTLEQIRSLGELKDDGYITEEEFQKIKKKILDDQT